MEVMCTCIKDIRILDSNVIGTGKLDVIVSVESGGIYWCYLRRSILRGVESEIHGSSIQILARYGEVNNHLLIGAIRGWFYTRNRSRSHSIHRYP